jgi:NAD(P)-dependent dehydrogenase (short-subunit alcohol dehydrogenase family)
VRTIAWAQLSTTILITGGNRGLGFEAGRQLIALGHDVWLDARDKQRGEAAADLPGARFVQLDVTDAESVWDAAGQVGSDPGGLDVLVNNAGIGSSSKTAKGTTTADVAKTYETNVIGLARETHAFLPLLLASRHGVIDNVGSGLGSLTRMSDPSTHESQFPRVDYGSSKSAVSMLTVQCALPLPELRVNVVNPGWTATDFTDHQGTQTVDEGVIAVVTAATLGTDGPTGTFIDRYGNVPS